MLLLLSPTPVLKTNFRCYNYIVELDYIPVVETLEKPSKIDIVKVLQSLLTYPWYCHDKTLFLTMMPAYLYFYFIVIIIMRRNSRFVINFNEMPISRIEISDLANQELQFHKTRGPDLTIFYTIYKRSKKHLLQGEVSPYLQLVSMV